MISKVVFPGGDASSAAQVEAASSRQAKQPIETLRAIAMTPFMAFSLPDNSSRLKCRVGVLAHHVPLMVGECTTQSNSIPHINRRLRPLNQILPRTVPKERHR